MQPPGQELPWPGVCRQGAGKAGKLRGELLRLLSTTYPSALPEPCWLPAPSCSWWGLMGSKLVLFSQQHHLNMSSPSPPEPSHSPSSSQNEPACHYGSCPNQPSSPEAGVDLRDVGLW